MSHEKNYHAATLKEYFHNIICKESNSLYSVKRCDFSEKDIHHIRYDLGRGLKFHNIIYGRMFDRSYNSKPNYTN